MSIIKTNLHSKEARDRRAGRHRGYANSSAPRTSKDELRRMLADAAANTPPSVDRAAALRIARQERRA